MAIISPLTTDTKHRIAQSLDSFIYPELDNRAADAQDHKTVHVPPNEETFVGESFPVWSVSVERLVQSVSINRLATWKKVWHHQIRGKRKGSAIAYSRTRESEGDSPHEVLGLFHSKLASEIDYVIEWIDNEHPEFDDGWAARLLTIPEIQLTAIWLLRAEESWLVPLDRPQDEHVVRPFRLIGEETFREECLNKPRIDGFRGRPIDQPPPTKLAPIDRKKEPAKSIRQKRRSKERE